MCAMKGELGLVVIELCVLPFILIVARLAFRAVATRMHILKAMTGDACLSEILVNFANVAGRASDVLMSAFEGEFGFAVIERLGAAPFRNRMTTVAFLQPALVWIDPLMTIETQR
jgi:hypothetical protein